MPQKTIVTIAVITLVVVGAAAYLGLSQAPQPATEEQGGQEMGEKQTATTTPETEEAARQAEAPVQPSSPQGSTPTDEIDTSDWKTYQSDELKYM